MIRVTSTGSVRQAVLTLRLVVSSARTRAVDGPAPGMAMIHGLLSLREVRRVSANVGGSEKACRQVGLVSVDCCGG